MMLKEIIIQYVAAKVDLMVCMAVHEKEVCRVCGYFKSCQVCDAYIKAWRKLQEFAEKSVKNG